MKTKFTGILTCFFLIVNVCIAQKKNAYNPCLPAPAFTTPVTKTIDIANEITLEYVEQGCVNGTPVILLHGFTDSWHSFEMILPHLPAGLHVYAITMRGHGNSSKPESGYLPEDFSRDIARFIHQLNIDKPVLVGHSMGGTIAQSFAAIYPQLTRGIVLAGSFADYNTTAISDFKIMIDQLTDPVDNAFAAAFQRGTAVRPVDETMMRIFIEETAKVPAYVWKGVAAGWAGSGYHRRLKNYKEPALILWGDKDAFCSFADQELLHSALQKPTLIIYQGTGHALHWEEPHRFAGDIAAFIETIR